MNAAEALDHYRQQGLVAKHVTDEPGKVYEPHVHERTILFTLAGSVKLKLGNADWQTLTPGQERVIESRQQHQAEVGPKGWEYVAAWDAEEARQFAFDHP